MAVNIRSSILCISRLLTHHPWEARPGAGRKGQPEGSPVEHKDPLAGNPDGHRGPLEDSLAGRMGLGEGSSAEARRTAHMGPRRARVQVLRRVRQREQLQPCARHQSHLQPYVNIKVLSLAIASSLYIPRAFMSRAPPARPAAAPPAPYNCSKMSVRCRRVMLNLARHLPICCHHCLSPSYQTQQHELHLSQEEEGCCQHHRNRQRQHH